VTLLLQLLSSAVCVPFARGTDTLSIRRKGCVSQCPMYRRGVPEFLRKVQITQGQDAEMCEANIRFESGCSWVEQTVFQLKWHQFYNLDGDGVTFLKEETVNGKKCKLLLTFHVDDRLVTCNDEDMYKKFMDECVQSFNRTLTSVTVAGCNGSSVVQLGWRWCHLLEGGDCQWQEMQATTHVSRG
jgi:hypothetical protein